MINLFVIPVDTMIQESLIANQELVMYEGITHVIEIVGGRIALAAIIGWIGNWMSRNHIS